MQWQYGVHYALAEIVKWRYRSH